MFLPFSLMICIFDLILVNGLMILISLNIMISDCLVDVVELLPLPNLTFLSPYNLTSLLNKELKYWMVGYVMLVVVVLVVVYNY